MIVITERAMEEAINFLADTDLELAELLADMERAEWKAKTIKNACFTILSGTVADREAKATIAEETKQAFEDYFQAVSKYNGLRNKRATQQILIDCWRSVNSSRNRGAFP
jgi:hypothetical protein